MKKLRADFAIVAAGPSGLAAAITCAEKGYQVIVFEKNASPGGTANMGMGPFGVESRIQRASMISLTKEEAFQFHMNYVHWNVDARIVRDYFFKSGETIDWLEDMGVEFFGAMRYHPSARETWHAVKPAGGGVPGPRAASSMIKVMYERALELGVTFYFNAPVQGLLCDGNGVYGYRATDADGEEYEVEADAVLVATGGFGDNPEMIQEYTGFEYGKDIFNNRSPGVQGDGIRMMLEAGARRGRSTMEKIISSGKVPASTLARVVFRQPSALIVNKSGDRVFDETYIDNTAVSANVLDIQQDKCLYSIIDNRLLEYYRAHGVDYPNGVRREDPTVDFERIFGACAEEYSDHCFVASSLEEIAEKAGIKKAALAATFAEYNQACYNNYDDLFGKARRFLRPIDGGETFYCMKICMGAYGSLGGVQINYKYEVLNDDYEPIEGLYASGSDVCDIYAGTYIFDLPGNTMGFALNSGRIAAEHMVEFIESLEE